ncbi:pentatricopeptide repeat-containing protein At2g33680-like [Aristolochia californica]|uniref:pentatricopeptide repeat-containing protein At2g33680-like n=1 Tax=Aristolochia californica TaxID=171875 RepID=UPI0035D56EDB
MAGVLRDCLNLAALEQGKQVHFRIIKYGLGLEIPNWKLANLYAKCGAFKMAQSCFQKNASRGCSTWAWLRVVGLTLADYNIVPKVEHNACMVDLLSRAGMLQKAQ